MNINEFAKLENKNELMYFAFTAKNDVPKWEKIKQFEIFHEKKYGIGKIIGFTEEKNQDLLISIKFINEDEIKKFEYPSFANGIFKFSNKNEFDQEIIEIINNAKIEVEKEKVRIEEEKEKVKREIEFKRKVEEVRLAKLAEIERQKQKEAKEKAHFAQLKTKYEVSHRRETSPVSELYILLLKIDDDLELSEEEISWFEKQKLFYPLGCYFEKNNNNFWDSINAAKYFRKATHYTKSLSVLQETKPKDEYETSVLLTVRGAVLRKLGNLDEAEDCANNSIKIRPNDFYPHNLLGAIYYQTGKYELGDDQFKTAASLGSSSKEIENQIRDVVENNSREMQIKIAQDLLNKDPERFKWAEYYLKN